MSTPTLDPHCELILDEYRSRLTLYEQMAAGLTQRLRGILNEAGILVAALESRVKTESSLAGKLALKGNKYHDINDITDVIGLRVITFYLDDVDKVASLVDRHFDIDWDNSVDKRKAHQIDSFGYMSLHYICRLPAAQRTPENAGVRFEIQMRTVLQHAWANMNHDTGYKSGVEVPQEYLRSLSRLAGILELVDEQFSRIRTDLNDYRRNVRSLVASGNLDDVPLDGESLRSYLAMDPFGPLNRKIASVNQAEIQEISLMHFLPVFKLLQFRTLGDVAKLIRDYGEAAFQIACYQISITDLDIIASTVGPQDLCIAYIVSKGGGIPGLKLLLDQLNGESESNEMMARILLDQVGNLPFMNTNR